MKLIFEFAEHKKEIYRQLADRRQEFITHMLCLYFFPNDDSVNHWMKEIHALYSDIPKYKHSNKYPSADYIYDAIFGNVEDVFYDSFSSKIDVVSSKEDRDVEHWYTDDVVNCFEIIQTYTLWLSKQLSTKGSVNRLDCFKLLNKLFYVDRN